MSDESAVIRSVIRKLSALRATMSKEEQAILDSVVIRHAEDEVVAHSMVRESVVRDTGAVQTATVRYSKPEEDEVVAHSMDPEATVRKEATVRAAPTDQAVIRFSIAFDAAEGEYQATVRQATVR